jgi:hypothetical protein
VIILVIAVVLAAVALAVRYRTDQRIAGDYLAVAKDVSDGQALLAGRLEDIFVGISDVGRPELLQRLDALVEESAVLTSDLESAEVTASTSEANGFLTVATTSWTGGLSAVRDSVIQILDEPDVAPQGDTMLAAAFNELRVGDSAYLGFLGTLDEMDPDVVTLEYPVFGYTAPPRAEIYDAVTVAGRMRVILKLEVNHDVAITATTDPEPLGENNGFPVVPHSESFAVHAVVTNTGNLPEEAILVQLFLDPRDQEEATVEIQTLVPFLEAGEAKTVAFEDLPVIAGSLYELRISVTIADEDGNADDNVWELVFYRNTP